MSGNRRGSFGKLSHRFFGYLVPIGSRAPTHTSARYEYVWLDNGIVTVCTSQSYHLELFFKLAMEDPTFLLFLYRSSFYIHPQASQRKCIDILFKNEAKIT